MDARILSVGVALVLIALVGALAAQLGQEQGSPAGAATETPIATETPGAEWIITTTTTSGGITTTTTLTRTGPTTASTTTGAEQEASTGEAVETETETAIITVTTTVTKPTSTDTEEGHDGPTPIIGGEQPTAGEVIKIKVDRTVKTSQGWATIKTVTLALDPKLGTLQVNTSLVLPDPCWKSKASLEVEGQAAILTIYLERNPAAMCIQVISDSTITAEAPASGIPSKLTIVMVINGEQHTITVDIGESPQPKTGP